MLILFTHEIVTLQLANLPLYPMDCPFAALAGIAGSSFVLALSGALMPGPLLTVTIAEAARRGAKAGPLIVTGHVILEFLLVVAVVKGLGLLLKTDAVVGTISLLGGIVLLVMGIDMVRKAPSMSMPDNVSISCRRSRDVYDHPVILGIVGSISNPYWTIWWVTIGLGYMATAAHFGFPGLAAFFLGHIAADYSWYVLVALGISQGRSVISERGYRFIIQACGTFLVGFGLWFLSCFFKLLCR